MLFFQLDMFLRSLLFFRVSSTFNYNYYRVSQPKTSQRFLYSVNPHLSLKIPVAWLTGWHYNGVSKLLANSFENRVIRGSWISWEFNGDELNLVHEFVDVFTLNIYFLKNYWMFSYLFINDYICPCILFCRGNCTWHCCGFLSPS